MKILKVIALCVAAFCALGNQSCQTTNSIVLPSGPKAAALMAAKDDQIKGLVSQVKAEQEARLMDQALASKAASGLKGILKAREYLPDSPVKEAIGLESDLALTRLPPDDSAETVKALERVVAIVTGQRDEAQRLYREANAATAVERAAKEAKDKQIAALSIDITNREARIAVLTDEAEAEKIAHKNDVEKALAAKDKALADQAAEFASKERATWVLWTRIAGLLFIVGGAVIAIVFKIVPEGAAFVGVGVVIGLVSIFIDWLTRQVWFPWVCGGILLVMLGIGGYALYRMWKKNTLQIKVTAALQDLKDESNTLGNDVWDKVTEHLNYRLGEKDGAAQKKLAASLGLVNLAAETPSQSPKS